tara:strand:- start:2578 stop:2826 length:249 start_codon:yes stop_codon:yes gene_type:complete
MNQGSSKPETASVRIREDTMALVIQIAEHYGIKNVDVVDAMAEAWMDISDEHRDEIIFGPEDMAKLTPPPNPNQVRVTYKRK